MEKGGERSTWRTESKAKKLKGITACGYSSAAVFFKLQCSGSHTYILSVIVLWLGTQVGFITGRQAGAAILVKSSDHLSTLMSRAYYAQWQSGTLNRRQPGCMAPSWSISYRKRGRSRILGPGSESFSWALLWGFPLGNYWKYYRFLPGKWPRLVRLHCTSQSTLSKKQLHQENPQKS